MTPQRYNTMIYTRTPNCYKVTFRYHQLLVACVKRIPSAKYHATEDCNFWEVSPQHENYLKIMADWAIARNICNRVLWCKDDEPIESYEIPEMPKLQVPHNMLIEPYEYQKEGIAYALQKKRCIMGDEPGLGKTAQAIGTLTASGAFPALVICPSSLKTNWQRELKKFGDVQAIILRDCNKHSWQRFWEVKDRRGEPLAKVFITNYESLKKYFVKEIKPHKKFTSRSIVFDERINLFRSVIIDESHKCKNSQAQQSKFVQGIAKGKEYVLELTGTPVVNNNKDLIQQLKIMERLEDFGGQKHFIDRYCSGYKEASNLKELNFYLNKFCFFRRQKKDVLKWLPEKTRSYCVVDIDTKKEYKEAQRDLIFHNGAVAVLPITDEGKTILVKQYRKAIERTSVEIPAGKLEKGENADPQAAALRELEEEIGYTADLELLYDFYSAIGFCNERIKLYAATNLKKVESPRPQDADETLELLEVTLKEAKDLIQTGEICDAKTIMAIQYWDLINK